MTLSLLSCGKSADISPEQGCDEHGSTGLPSGLVASKHRNGGTVMESSIELTSSVTGA